MDIAPISMYYGLNVDQNLFNWYSHLWGAGTDIFDENWEPIFNNETGLAATEQYLSYVRDGYSPEASIAWITNRKPIKNWSRGARPCSSAGGGWRAA